MSQENQLAIAGRQRRDRLGDPPLELTSAQDVIGRRIASRNRGSRGGIFGGRGLAERERTRLSPAQVIDRPVGGDAVEPRRESVARIEGVEGKRKLEGGLPGQIPRHVAGGPEAGEGIHEPALMTKNQRSEGVAI